MKFLWPYIWPQGETLLQFYVVVCFVLLILGRVAYMLIPVFYAEIVEALSVNDLSRIPYSHILIYTFTYFLSGTGFGGSGFLPNIRSFCWIQIQQYSSRRTMVQIFAHLHDLSLKWHLG